MFLADIEEDDPEPDDGNVTEMNFFYIRQFQVHLHSTFRDAVAISLSVLRLKSNYLFIHIYLH